MADQLISGTTLIEDKRGERGNVWSTSGISFIPANPAADSVLYDLAGDGSATSQSADLEFKCPVELPHGVTVNNVVVYGDAASAAGITWTLDRVDHTGTETVMASAAVNTEDTTISNEVINNDDFFYFLSSGLNEWDANDRIFGARIKYT